MSQTFSHLTNGYVRNDNVNLKLAVLGAPGSGKSTLSAGLLYFTKLFLFKTDSVPEVAKWDFYKGVDFTSSDYEYQKFDRQKDLEDIYPEDLEITICEAPLIISAIYAAYYRGDDHPIAKDMFDLAWKNKDRYSHFLVSRKLVKFESFGRNESENQAEQLHLKTLEILERLQINYTVINRYDDHIPIQILDMVGAISQNNLDKKHVDVPIPHPHQRIESKSNGVRPFRPEVQFKTEIPKTPHVRTFSPEVINQKDRVGSPSVDPKKNLSEQPWPLNFLH